MIAAVRTGPCKALIMVRRQQCAKCPWRTDVDPHDIPNGYCEVKHAALSDTIAVPGAFSGGSELRMMACHGTPVGKEQACIGWLAHQLGPGNNIPLRLRMIHDRELGNFELVGEQHECFEDTLPDGPANKRKRPARNRERAHVGR